MTATGATIVLDVGKTLSKASLWSAEGRLIAHLSRPNARVQGPGYQALDAVGIESWLAGALSQLAAVAPVAAIVPVAHGAAFALVRDGQLVLPPMDYEQPVPAAVRDDYARLRDPFGETGSPVLPDGLNAGVQLYWLTLLRPAAFAAGTQIVPWAQYWAWRLCGVAASEVTSLGCHTDLWQPLSSRPSVLAQRQGWAALLAPLRGAGDVLGLLAPEWIARTGLPAATRVHCGLHDSNAALLAARAFPEIGEGESTVLSTGTWFVALRTPSAAIDPNALPEGRDCLLNVDAQGRAVPSARFMGGREIEMLTAPAANRIDTNTDQQRLLDAVPQVLAAGARVLPSLVAGCGPYPHARGRWVSMPADDARHRATICLYAALMADTALDLIGSRERLLVEGRFAEAQVLVRALASLRPGQAIYTAPAHNDVSYGALRLLSPSLVPAAKLQRVAPLEGDFVSLRASWRAEAEALERAA